LDTGQAFARGETRKLMRVGVSFFTDIVGYSVIVHGAKR